VGRGRVTKEQTTMNSRRGSRHPRVAYGPVLILGLFRLAAVAAVQEDAPFQSIPRARFSPPAIAGCPRRRTIRRISIEATTERVPGRR